MISAQLKRSQCCALNLKRFEISQPSDAESYGNGDKHVLLILANYSSVTTMCMSRRCNMQRNVEPTHPQVQLVHNTFTTFIAS
jgi:hypothetical protein